MQFSFAGDVLFGGLYFVYVQGGSMLSLLKCKNPLHLLQHMLIETTGDVLGVMFDDLSQDFICWLILSWVSLDVDFSQIVHLPRACPEPFLPSHDGWDL